MSKAPSRTLDQYIVRFPEGMRDRIKAQADANGRSMNAEIVLALSDHLDNAERGDAAWKFVPPEFFIDEMHRSMLIAQSEEIGWPVQEVLREAILRSFGPVGMDHEDRERRMRLLTAEIVDLVRHHIEQQDED